MTRQSTHRARPTLTQDSNWLPRNIPTVKPVLFLLPFLTAASGAQDQFRIDDASLQRIVDKLVPLVEKHTDRKFARRPVVLLSDSKEMGDSLAQDLFVSLHKLAANADEERVRWYAEFLAHTDAARLFGKFGLVDEKLYVEPEKVALTLSLLDHEEALYQPFFELVVAHELTHAMQHQELDLLRSIAAIDDQDCVHTFNSRVEGHALFVHERIASELGYEEAAELFRTLISPDPAIGAATSQTAFITRTVRQLSTTYYLTGAQRIAELFAAGGHEHIWQAMRSEPPPSRSIFLPIDDRDLQPMVDYAGVLEGAERVCGSRRWLVMRGNLGEALLRSENSHAANINSVLRSFRGGQFCQCVLRGVTQLGLVSALAFADAERARNYVEISEQSTAVDASRARNTDVLFRDIDCPAEMEGRRYEQGPQRMGGALRGSLLWLRQNRFVLQVFSSGFLIKDTEATALATTVFARMREK